jgi:integrase
MGRRSVSGGVREERGKIRLDFRWKGQRLKPVLDLAWNERNRLAAVRMMDEIRTKIRHGVFDPAAYFPEYRGLARVGVERQQAPTFRTMAEAYLKTIGELAHSTRVSYERILEGHWYEAIGERPVNTILPLHLHAVLADLRAKTRNNVLIPCRAVLAYAEDNGVLESNPAAKIKNAKVQKDEPDPFDLDEVEAIVTDLRRHSAEDADYFEFAFFTGLRVSEQIAVTWRDHDRKRGLLRVRRARVWAEDSDTTKTHQARNVELLDRAAAVLVRQRARTELASAEIFRNPRTERAWNDEQVQRKVLDASLKRLGIRHRPPKQTRHTFATLALMAGANPAWVARQLGHRSTKMLYEVYSKWIDGADKGLERGKVEAWIGPQLGRGNLIKV